MTKFECICSIAAAYRANKNMKIEDQNELDTKRVKWEKKLSKKDIETTQIGYIVRSVYNDENMRRSCIENKGSWLLIGASISAILTSIMLNSPSDSELSWIINLIFGYSVINFTLAGIGVYCATRIVQMCFLDVNEILDKNENSEKLGIDIIIEQLITIERNQNPIQKKTNFVFAAQNHFIIGLLSMVTGFMIVLANVVI